MGVSSQRKRQLDRVWLNVRLLLTLRLIARVIISPELEMSYELKYYVSYTSLGEIAFLPQLSRVLALRKWITFTGAYVPKWLSVTMGSCSCSDRTHVNATAVLHACFGQQRFNTLALAFMTCAFFYQWCEYYAAAAVHNVAEAKKTSIATQAVSRYLQRCLPHSLGMGV
jgi:hypothetical protein